MLRNQKELVFYNDRAWLNSYKSSFTGSVVSYLCLEEDEKPDDYELKSYSEWDDHLRFDAFVEFADCQGKVRLHSGSMINRDVLEQAEEFMQKLELMRDSIDGEMSATQSAIEKLKKMKNDFVPYIGDDDDDETHKE